MKTFIITGTVCAFSLIGFGIFMIADLVITGLIWLAWWLAAMAVLGPAYVGILAWRRQAHNHMRPKDGSFAMQKHWHDPAPKRLLKTIRGQQPEFTMWNPNNDPGYAARFNGKIEPMEPAAGWGAQLAYAELSKKHAIAQSMFPGDDAISSKNGSMYRPGGNGAAQRMIGKIAERPQAKIIDVAPTPPALPMLPAPPMLLEDAFSQSRPDYWLLGHNPDSQISTGFNPLTQHNIGIVGAPGTGKTTASGYHLLLLALRFGWQVAILDPKGGVDLRLFAGVAEWHDTDPANFYEQIQAIAREHERRHQILIDHQVGTIDELRTSELPHILIMIEEYGALREEIEMSQKRSQVERLDYALDSMMRLSRMTGIHFAFIDQFPEKWSPQVFAATKYRMVYQVAPGQDAFLKEYKADQLPDRGWFQHRRNWYESWHVKPFLGGMLAALPANRYPRLIDGTTVPGGVPNTVPTAVHSGVPSGVLATVPPVTPYPPVPMNAGNGKGKWYDWAIDYVAEHQTLLQQPPAGVREMARAMSQVETGNETHENDYASEASRLCKRIRKEAGLGNDISVLAIPQHRGLKFN